MSSASPPPAIQNSNTPAIVAGIVIIAIVVTIALVYVETRPGTSGPPATVTVCGTVSSGAGFYNGDTYRLDFKTSSQLTSATVATNLSSSCVFSMVGSGCNKCYNVDLTNSQQFSVHLVGSGQVFANQSCGGLYLSQPNSPYRFDVSC